MKDTETEMKKDTLFPVIMFFVWIIGATTSAFIYKGEVAILILPFKTCLLISIGAGILMGIATTIRYKMPLSALIKNIILGLLSTVPVFLAIIWYISVRDSFWRIESVLPIAVGMIPFALLAYILYLRRWRAEVKAEKTAEAKKINKEKG
ncbi:MAG TPA: hypothetical protein PK358_17415 [Spirochaetota bacterium]|nr:hypothetical protein [Spirochaetota bacterium]HPJ36620.1 hypothetical protein [Spirochaetota bacterium]